MSMICLYLLLGITAAAARARETTRSPTRTIGPAEIPARPDTVFAAPAPATATRAEAAENCCSDHAGEEFAQL